MQNNAIPIIAVVIKNLDENQINYQSKNRFPNISKNLTLRLSVLFYTAENSVLQNDVYLNIINCKIAIRLHFKFCSAYNMILIRQVEFVKVSAPTPYTNNKIRIQFRIFLCIKEFFTIY